jgi:RES domain-containing protein
MRRGWRILKTSRAATAFDGEGARLHGGRWNSPGTAVVYTSESLSLAVLELLVHLQATRLLGSYCSIAVDFDDALVDAVEAAALPRGWTRYPAPSALQEIGDQWVAGRRSVVLRVPSAVVPGESNFLLNPGHPDFARVVIGPPRPFVLDPRLTERSST